MSEDVELQYRKPNQECFSIDQKTVGMSEDTKIGFYKSEISKLEKSIEVLTNQILELRIKMFGYKKKLDREPDVKPKEEFYD